MDGGGEIDKTADEEPSSETQGVEPNSPFLKDDEVYFSADEEKYFSAPELNEDSDEEVSFSAPEPNEDSDEEVSLTLTSFSAPELNEDDELKQESTGIIKTEPIILVVKKGGNTPISVFNPSFWQIFYQYFNRQEDIKVPLEMLGEILKFLSFRDVMNLLQVNRTFRRAVFFFWKNVLKNIKDEDRLYISNLLLKSVKDKNEEALQTQFERYYGQNVPEKLRLKLTNDEITDNLLHSAAKEGNLNNVKYLVETASMNVNAQDEYGETPVYVAAEKGHLDVVKYLVEKEADPNIADLGGITPIYIATQKGHLDIVRYLVEEAKAEDPNKARNDGRTPI